MPIFQVFETCTQIFPVESLFVRTTKSALMASYGLTITFISPLEPSSESSDKCSLASFGNFFSSMKNLKQIAFIQLQYKSKSIILEVIQTYFVILVGESINSITYIICNEVIIYKANLYLTVKCCLRTGYPRFGQCLCICWMILQSQNHAL